MTKRLFQKFGSLAIAFVLILNFGLLLPSKVGAQIPVTDVAAATHTTLKELWDAAKVGIKNALISSVASSLTNVMTRAANNAARDAAIWVASGGNADEPLFEVRPSSDYMHAVAMDTTARFYNELSAEGLEGGFWDALNICMPHDANIMLALRIGMKSSVSPIECLDCPALDDNLDKLMATLSAAESMGSLTSAEITGKTLDLLAKSFDPNTSGISVGAKIQYTTYAVAQFKAQQEASLATFNHGFKSIRDPITGEIITPANMVEGKLRDSYDKSGEITTKVALNALTNTDTLLSVGAGMTSMFTNTLLSEVMQNMQNGVFSSISGVNDNFNPFDENSAVTYSREKIAEKYSSLGAFRPLQVSNYSLLTELSSCVTDFHNVSKRSLYSCAMDSNFASAVSSANTGDPLTIADAIDEGFIKGDWPLIPSSDKARNQSSQCYTYGYCYSNLVKLRKARIISIGWEIATESEANSQTNPVTLNEVIAGFYNCNSDDEIDASHPWCHLIDPNWILKFPDTQCRTMAYGQTLTAANIEQRSEECVDIQSCISEDDNGNCDGGYGYCVREENVWEFRGDNCPAEYASCMTFTDTNSQGDEDDTSVNYLTNTLDYNNCNSDNAGCLWYGLTKDETNDEFDWPEIVSVEDTDAASDTYKNRIYFNDNIETCDESSGGCQEIITRDENLSLNILDNPSFESDENRDLIPDSWISSGINYDSENGEDRSGDSAINVGSSGLIYQYATLSQNRFYTLSTYSKQDSAGGSSVAGIFMTDEDGNALDLSAVSYTDTTCSQVDNSFQISLEPTETDYERFDCTFTTPALANPSDKIYAVVDLYGGDVWIDDIQLEQTEDASSFHSAYSDSSLNYNSVKIAPEYLGCTGEDDDPSECDNYAPICSEQEVGCTLYTPVNGDPSLSAITNELDSCSSSCAGYDTFRQEETLYEPDGVFPVYFIASSAEECNEEAVGCDEFTNLQTEGLEYFTYLRSCLTVDEADANTNGDNAAIFYTWEGSDEEGYQLKTWNLLESDLDSSTYSSYVYADSGEIDNYPGKAPCTNWVSIEDGIQCNDDINGDGNFDTETDQCDEHSDILENPDCREFYDTDGDIHYREWSDSVTVDNECLSYRKTDIVGNDVTERAYNCKASGGYFDANNGFCRYYGFSEESTECTVSENGCRKYTGGRSANSRVAFKDTFESGTLDNWSATSASDITLSNTSIATDGHSLKSVGLPVWTFLYQKECSNPDGCDSITGKLGGSCMVVDGGSYCGTLENELFTNKTYTLSFWAKGDTDLTVGFDIDARPAHPVSEVEFDDISLESDWQEYSIGPLNMNESDYPNFGEGTVLVFQPDLSTGTFYIDNIVLREGEDNITVIKDSWNTPAVCDMNLEGETDNQYQLGCQEYINSDGNNEYFKSFSSLCTEDKIGCDSYYTTNQSESEYTSVYNATCYNVDTSATASIWTTPDVATERTKCYLATSNDGTSFNDASLALCNIETGDNSCEFDMEDWFLPEVAIEVGTDFSQTSLYHINYGPDATFVEADEELYAIVSSTYECADADIGCEEVGKPTFSSDQSTVVSWDSTWLLNKPDDYSDILCADEELFCKAWDSSDEGTWYFKNPISHTCEYKTDITIGSQTYDGWFQDGTSEFCYGAGYCADDTSISCSLDSDCTGLDCVIDTGSYLIGGDTSGLWRDGDEDYAGWVGLCSEDNDGCTEYQDPSDIKESEFYGSGDGEQYFYLDNDNLDENTLLSSQRCNNQVSQNAGCVLFNDAGDTGLDYNASASYVVSAHADVFVGDSTFALVDPIDCDDEDGGKFTINGEEFDVCANRCVYKKWDLDSSFNPDDIDTTDLSTMVELGGACYSDTDCQNYTSDTSDLVKGTCENNFDYNLSRKFPLAFPLTLGDGNLSLDINRLENDTNTVLKVARDRECSEWLSCSSSYTVWDETTNQYKTICDSVGLCDEYSSSGDSSFCASWNSDSSTSILDADKYSNRDVSWYGDEYSGYSVPDNYPIEHLSQVNIAPPLGFCDLSDEYNPTAGSTYTMYHGESCSDDSDCGGTADTCVTENVKDYHLGFVAGTCDEEYAESCVIGYCDSDGSACAEDSDCNNNGDCVTGVCYAVSIDNCVNDSNCDDDQTCLAGSCVSAEGNCDEGDVDLTYACGSGETCVPSEAAKEGNCLSGSCFLPLNGDAFNSGSSEGALCRAQPEIDSPFPTSTVDEWETLTFNSADLTQSDLDEHSEEYNLSEIADATVGVGSDNEYGGTIPYKRKSTFGNTKVCATGEDCECSYQKVASNEGAIQYIDYDTNLDDINIQGLCSADSPVAGALCTDDDDCRIFYDRSSATTGLDDQYVGTCQRIVKKDSLIGLEGYCLEKDSAININGDASENACLTWFPVDKISGATDLYAKYTDAGFDQEDVYYCGYVGLYYDMYTSNSTEHGFDSTESGFNTQIISCAETHNYQTCSGGSDGTLGCWKNAVCPDGYYAIMGGCGNTTTYQNECQKSNDDCPYVCVPENSYNINDGSSCEDIQDVIDNSGSGASVYDTYQADFGSADNVVYGIKSGFTDTVKYAKNCAIAGITDKNNDWNDLSYGDTIPSTCSISNNYGEYSWNCTGGGGNGYYNYVINPLKYPACSILIKASGGAGENYAYTDRLLKNSISIDSLGYKISTVNTPYGRSLAPSDVKYTSGTPADKAPARVASCCITSDCITLEPSTSSACDVKDYKFSTSSTSPDARNYIDFDITMENSPAYWQDYSPSISFNGEGISDIIDRFNQIFARIEGIWYWSEPDASSTTGKYVEACDGNNCYDGGTSSIGNTSATLDNYTDDSDVRVENGSPPTVWAVDTDNCGPKYCHEGDEDAITLNNTNSGNQTADGGYFRAIIKFFAGADKNQLPIRRVIIDWGDEHQSGSDADDNFYKNHRGLQDDSDTKSKCDLDTEWGLTSSSCDPNYFTYNHTYTCSDNYIDILDECVDDNGDGNLDNSPCKQDGMCVYQPRVHVRDNWGFCAGICDSSYTKLNIDGDSRCFDGYYNVSFSDHNSECNYSHYPEHDSFTDPWVYYNGKIYIEP